MYLSHEQEGEPKIVPPPDANAGLWICPRRKGAKPVKVSIPADCLGRSKVYICESRNLAKSQYNHMFLQRSRLAKLCKFLPTASLRPRLIT